MLPSAKSRWLILVLCFAIKAGNLQGQQLVGNWNVSFVPTADDIAWAGSTAPVWKLHMDGANIVASHVTSQDRRPNGAVALPEHFRMPTTAGVPDTLQPPARVPVSLHLEGGGWLIGFDAGEWGGSLWSTNEDGSQTKNLLWNNVHALFQVPGGVIVLVGLAHMTLDEGKAIFVPSSSWDTAEAHVLADLHSSPEASVQESPATIVVATHKAVLRISTSRLAQTVFEAQKPLSAPYSVLVADGTIYVGMRGYVLRLLPESTGYRPEWLSPTATR